MDTPCESAVEAAETPADATTGAACGAEDER